MERESSQFSWEGYLEFDPVIVHRADRDPIPFFIGRVEIPDAADEKTIDGLHFNPFCIVCNCGTNYFIPFIPKLRPLTVDRNILRHVHDRINRIRQGYQQYRNCNYIEPLWCIQTTEGISRNPSGGDKSQHHDVPRDDMGTEYGQASFHVGARSERSGDQ